MSRQYFEDTLVDPPTLNPLAAAIVATTETQLWPASSYSPINVGDIRPGKAYKVSAGGIMTWAATGTLIITPRIGLTVAGITMGANAAITTPGVVTAQPWFLDFMCIIRTVGLAGVASTCIGNGRFIGPGLGTLGNAGVGFSFGGASATFDASIASGLTFGWTLSVAGSCTPEWVTMQSLN